MFENNIVINYLEKYSDLLLEEKINLQNYIFPLPPFAEQRRIVAKIEELFAEIDKLK